MKKINWKDKTNEQIDEALFYGIRDAWLEGRDAAAGYADLWGDPQLRDAILELTPPDKFNKLKKDDE